VRNTLEGRRHPASLRVADGPARRQGHLGFDTRGPGLRDFKRRYQSQCQSSFRVCMLYEKV
jgi:hypothetical protein